VASLTGFNELIARLGKQAQDTAAAYSKSVIVGYTQAYAIYVHENLEAHHPVGQAKFLEQPAREHAKEIGTIIRESIERGVSFEQSLLLGALRLQRESQQLCPNDTGALRASAFTRIE
jgi:hypothetical protein